MPSRPVPRSLVYGALGWCAEVTFTGLKEAARSRDPRLSARTSLWMFPISALARPLFEPAHDMMRGRVPAPARAAIYAVGFLAVEYAAGRGLREAVGAAPWDYSHARWNLDGLVRLDYAPLWAVAGLALEHVHDRLMGRRPDRRSP